jgi:Flp pilus assembly protein TadD
MKNLVRLFSIAVIPLLLFSLSPSTHAAEKEGDASSSSQSETGNRDIRGSVMAFTKSISDTSSANGLVARGTLKFASGDSKGAINELTKAITLDPKSTKAYYSRATAKFAAGDIPGAIADILAGLKITVISMLSKG